MGQPQLETCRCGRWSQAACERPVTQEDLLCDECREGCAHLSWWWASGDTITDDWHIEKPRFPGSPGTAD